METLSFAGTPSGLMNYLKSLIPNCELCQDKGFIEKTEWSGDDKSYDVQVRCACSED